MKDVKVKRFTNTMWISDEMNVFLSEHDVEYVDMTYLGDNGVLLVYREKENTPKRKPYERYPENEKENEQNG